jgi:RHS repeat-associated protein
VTAGSRTANLDTSQTYDNEGKVLTVKYPDINSTGPTYTYAYDTMGRPTTLTDNQSATWVSGVQYGLSGELLSLNGETRTYNSSLQLTRITGGANMEYRYSPTQNNGQITQQKDWNTGEEVTYTYDTLQRLIGAVTTDSSWGQAFTYDGFGNRTSASVTKGMAPHGNWNYDPNTNRLAGSYDANGNSLDVGSYDVENRLVSVPASSNPEQYAYASDNKRIWRRKPDGTEELYYYGISGQKLVTITPLVAANGDFFLTTVDTNLYFGSRTIVSRGVTVTLDRVGSNRAGGSRYFPYGEEQQVTAQDRDKFATYYRDSTTGLDYAQNRYYASTLARFMSPDPYQASAGPSDPGSWNRYAYTRGDPVNRIDPSGQSDCLASGEGDSECVGPQDCPFGYIWSPFGGSCQPQGGGYPTCVEGYSFSPTFGDCEPDSSGGGPQPSPTASPCTDWGCMPPAFALAMQALTLNADCFNLFGNANTRQGKWNPTTVLTSLFGTRDGTYGSVNFNYTGNAAALTTPNGLPTLSVSQGIRGSSATVSINSSWWNIDNVPYNAETLLHELGHVYDFVRGSGGFALKNRAEIKNNQAFDQLIKQKCNLP